MDVTSLYTNIPHEEVVTAVCHVYQAPIPTKYLREMLYLILRETSFQFCSSIYLQTHGTAMRTKMAVAFANIFMARIERQINIVSELHQTAFLEKVYEGFNGVNP